MNTSRGLLFSGTSHAGGPVRSVLAKAEMILRRNTASMTGHATRCRASHRQEVSSLCMPRRSIDSVDSQEPKRLRSQVICFSSLVAQTGQTTALTSTEKVAYRFIIPEFVTKPGQELSIVGSLPELGGWDLANSPRMKWNEGHRWSVEVELPKTTFEFKVVFLDHRAGVERWEKEGNRVVHVEDASLPVDITVQVTCWFDAKETQLDIILPRASVKAASELSRATLEMLEAKRNKLDDKFKESEKDAAPSSTPLPEPAELQQEMAFLEESIINHQTVVDSLNEMLDNSWPFWDDDDQERILLPITRVRLPGFISAAAENSDPVFAFEPVVAEAARAVPDAQPSTIQTHSQGPSSPETVAPLVSEEEPPAAAPKEQDEKKAEVVAEKLASLVSDAPASQKMHVAVGALGNFCSGDTDAPDSPMSTATTEQLSSLLDAATKIASQAQAEFTGTEDAAAYDNLIDLLMMSKEVENKLKKKSPSTRKQPGQSNIPWTRQVSEREVVKEYA